MCIPEHLELSPSEHHHLGNLAALFVSLIPYWQYSFLNPIISQFLGQKTHMDFQIRLILQSWAENGEVTHQLTELMTKVCVHVPCTFQIYLKVAAIGEKKRRELL